MGTTTLDERRRRLSALFGLPANQEIPSQLQTEIDGFIARSLRDVYAFCDWTFLEFYSRVELEAAYTVGSVAITAGQTALTGTGTSWATGFDAAGVARVRSGDVYRVTSIGSTTGITLADAAIETLSGAAYVLYMDLISLDSTLQRIESMAVAVKGRRLLPMAPSEMDDHKSRGFYSGHPEYFCDRGVDSSGYRMVELYPIPGVNEILHIHGYKAGTIPTAQDGTDDVPQRWSNVVDERAKVYLWEYKNDKRYAAAESRWRELMYRMIQEESSIAAPTGIRLDPAVYGPAPVSTDVNTVSLD